MMSTKAPNQVPGTDLVLRERHFGSYDPNRKARPFDAYADLYLAYAFFNERLFRRKLRWCLITFQRSRAAYGYFSGDRFINVNDRTELTDEIALNPMYFAERLPIDVLATLVHEMVHLSQHQSKTAPRASYHNKQWAREMVAIGLQPSDTGKPGGKQTGDSMSHYIVEGGPFEIAAKEFLSQLAAVFYQDTAYLNQDADDRSRGKGAGGASGGDDERSRARKRKAASKTKFMCIRTGLAAWAKPEARLLCGCCRTLMPAAS